MSSMVIHKNLKDDDVHADIARTYASIAARDLDTAFSSVAANINKNVRVDSPLAVFKLIDVSPTFLNLSAGGDPSIVLGPASAVDLNIAIFDGITGKLIKDGGVNIASLGDIKANGLLTDNFLTKGDGTTVLQRASGDGIAGLFLNESNDILSLRMGSGVQQADIRILDDSGVEVFLLRANTVNPSFPTVLINTSGLLVLTSSNAIDLSTPGIIDLCSTGVAVSGVDIRRTGANDTLSVLALVQAGTNNGATSIFLGNRNPNGNVTGTPGNLYFSQEPGNPELFFHRGATLNNTDWRPLESVPERVGFSSDTTTDTLGKNFQIYACTDTTVTRTITISNSTIALGSPLLPHRFTIKDETSNARNFMILILTESGLIDGNIMSSISTDDGSLALYTDGTNTFIESEHTTPRDAVTFTGNSFPVNAQSGNPQSMIFSADGLKVFILDFGSNNMFQFNLTLPFSMAAGNVVYSGFSFNFTAQESTSTTISFNQDGTLMFMAGQLGDAIHSYTLSVGFDLSSTVISTGDFITFGAQDQLVVSVEWKPDGTKFFMLGRQNNSIFEFNVTTPYDVLTASYSGNSFSVVAQDGGPESLRFSPDGKRFFISGTISERIYQYNLTTPFSIASGVTFSGFSFDYSNEGDIATSLAFKPDGTKMFLVFSTPNPSRNIFEYIVSPAFSMEGA